MSAKEDRDTMGFGRSRPGQVLVLTALAIVVLCGFAGLVVDLGMLYTTKRRMQTAADAAAIAGVNALQGAQSGSYRQAAVNVAGLDGFIDGQDNVAVTVGPPANPPGPAGLQYVEVTVTQSVPVYFLRVLGYDTMDVSARAVAGTVGGPACIYALNPSASGALLLTGNFNVTSACGVMVNSSSSTALKATGNGQVTTTGVGVAGDFSLVGNVQFTPMPHIHIAPAPDPLAGLQPPSVGTVTQQSVTDSGNYLISGVNQTVTVPPGIYAGGIRVTGINHHVTFNAGSYGNGIVLNGINGDVVFNPGQYQSGGSGDSVIINGNATTTFNDGLYTFGGRVRLNGNNQVTLSPGLYEGGIWINGNANVTFNPGTYVLGGGGLVVNGNSRLTGSGLTFYVTSGDDGVYGPVNLNGNARVNVSAPTSGPFEGILFFQDRSIPSGSAASTINGNSQSTIDGAIYFPTTGLTYVGNSSGTGYTFLIADTIRVVGNSSFTVGSDYSSLSNGSPIKSSALYE